ncbi:hypothetical protein BS47DRAFT_377035 [Hydnum rufescens UP504]|uniref:Uncharacterized protein n=1 Tax=Hydnum rufescens UP504 TaxID=1448309 RepID=A0A9P6DY59_9AGAM|nr:hypothetical protein BS47DRAFT_377035 [Hydnum rufescens UP504]
MAQSVQGSIDALVQQHQGRQNRVGSIKQTAEGFHVYKASAAHLAKLCEQYEKLVYDILLGASEDFFGLIDKAAGEILVKGTATWEQALDEVQLRFYDFAAFDLRSQIEHAAAMADYITKTHKTMLQTMMKFIGNTSSKLAELGNLFREFQGSHQDTFIIVPDARMGEGKLQLALGADLTGLQKIRVTMARAARAANQSRVDTPPDQLPARTTIFPRDTPGRFQSPQTSCLREP